jgi:eukaryotic-like serine/threonine-protein kinase
MPAEAPRTVLQTVGNYDLVEKIAEGGMGTVYRGRDRTNGQVVAVKLVSPQMAANEVFRQRFEKEYSVARSLQHPNIVRAMDFGTSGGRPYLVMEFIDGESLGQRLERERRLPEDLSVRMICQAAQGLHAAHQKGVVHRDIKPDNLLLTLDGQVKIADMGLVKELDTDINLTRTGRGLGTPHFMAPEQFRNAKNADVRCDIYSLGATLYMMVTGKMPFEAMGPLDAWMKKVNNELAPPKKVHPGLTDRVDMAIQRAMDADPEQRPSSCLEFIEDLMGRGTGKRPTKAVVATAGHDLWYLFYRDEMGAPHKVKGTVSGIRRSLKENLLGDVSAILGSRTKTGKFEPLSSIDAFRDLVAEPKVEPKLSPAPEPAQGKSASRTIRSARKGPHIPLETQSQPGMMEWVKIGFLMLIAVGVGVIITLLFVQR